MLCESSGTQHAIYEEVPAIRSPSLLARRVAAGLLLGSSLGLAGCMTGTPLTATTRPVVLPTAPPLAMQAAPTATLAAPRSPPALVAPTSTPRPPPAPPTVATPRRPPAPPRPRPSPTRAAQQTPTPAPVGSTYHRAARPLVVLDAGHGGPETGARSSDGLLEKDTNLVITLAAAAHLRAAGVAVLLTRSVDSAVNRAETDVNGDGTVDVDDDLQARVDLANHAGAWLLVSIHNNALSDAHVHGTTTYYCAARPFASTSHGLAATLQAHVLRALQGAGFATFDRHVRDDPELHKPGGHLYLLGPPNKRIARPSQMPGALVETLFLSNAVDAAGLARVEILNAAGAGLATGIQEYLAEMP